MRDGFKERVEHSNVFGVLWIPRKNLRLLHKEVPDQVWLEMLRVFQMTQKPSDDYLLCIDLIL